MVPDRQDTGVREEGGADRECDRATASGRWTSGPSFAAAIAAAVTSVCRGSRHHSAPETRSNNGSLTVSILDR